MRAHIPEDYGGFAPRFFGASVRLHSEEDFTFLDEYMTDRLRDTDRRSLKSISLKSVFDHETRHFHDFLISPYGSFAFRAKIQAAISGTALIAIVENLPGNWLPAPILIWTKLDDKERDEHIAEWHATLGATVSIVDLPSVKHIDFSAVGSSAEVNIEKSSPEAALAFVIHSSSLAYKRLQQLTQGMVAESTSPELTPCNFFEILGLASQLQSIWLAQSAECAGIFWTMLQKSEASYAALWRRVVNLAQKLPTPQSSGKESPSLIDQIVAIAQWCTLGNFLLDNLRACPNARFLMLEEFLHSHGSDADIAYDVADVWARWDTALNVHPWRSGIERTVASNKAHSERLSAVKSGGIAYVASRVFGAFCQDQERAVRSFLADPNLLVKQERYVNSGAEIGLPIPIFRLELSGFRIACPPDGLWVPMWDEQPGAPVSQIVLRAHQDTEGFLAYSANFERMSLLSDLMMAGQEPPRGHNLFGYEDIKLFTKKKPLWVL